MTDTTAPVVPLKSLTQLFPCPHHVYCDVFNCRTVAKWFVGKPDGPRQCTFKLCTKCATTLVNMPPAELVDAEFINVINEEAIRLSITEQLRLEYETTINDLNATILDLEEMLAEVDLQPKDIVEEKPVEQEEKQVTTQIYRCLDCGFEAESADELAAHKSIHAEGEQIEGTKEEVVTVELVPVKPGKPSAAERLAARRGNK